MDTLSSSVARFLLSILLACLGKFFGIFSFTRLLLGQYLLEWINRLEKSRENSDSIAGFFISFYY